MVDSQYVHLKTSDHEMHFTMSVTDSGNDFAFCAKARAKVWMSELDLSHFFYKDITSITKTKVVLS